MKVFLLDFETKCKQQKTAVEDSIHLDKWEKILQLGILDELLKNILASKDFYNKLSVIK